jgi:hypothetical protein
MRWTKSHLHEFVVDGQSYGEAEQLDGDSDVAAEQGTLISRLGRRSSEGIPFPLHL